MVRRTEWDAAAIANDGERVTHLYPNDLYFAHLSLYRFALTFGQGAVVLDAGAGSGYGAAYMADHGAVRVVGVDVDAQAVAFNRAHFARDNLAFEVADIARLDRYADAAFDLVVCSNTLEHVPDVRAVLHGVRRLLVPGGTFVLAVPPVLDEAAQCHELLNPYHVHIWSPRQWRHVLLSYFAEVRPFVHRFARPDSSPDFRNAPESSVIDASDFAFDPIEGDAVYPPTLTALFVARLPVAESAAPDRHSAVTYVDGSFSRRPPGGPAVAPTVLTIVPRPARQLPRRAWSVLRAVGPVGLLAEARRYVRWRVHRRQARRLLAGARRVGRDDSV